MTFKWKSNVTASVLCVCLYLLLTNEFVHGVKVQQKRVKAATKGEFID